MNHLNNQQVVLLAILVSFVTSIATGIFTVSLLDQAPPTVTSTLNKVVEKTVEVVKPKETETIVREKIVVDKSGETVVSAVESTADSVVDIGIIEDKSDEESESSTSTPVFIKLLTGFFIQNDGSILTLADKLPADGDIFAVTTGSNKVKLMPAYVSEKYNLAILTPEEELKTPSLKLSDDIIAVGQTAIVLDTKEVAVTFISGVINSSEGNESYKVYFESNDSTEGRPIINVNGEVIGIVSQNNSIIPIKSIRAFLEAYENSKNTTEDNANSDETSAKTQ